MRTGQRRLLQKNYTVLKHKTLKKILGQCGECLLNHIQPEVGTCGMVALPRMEEQWHSVFLPLPIEGVMRWDGYILWCKAETTHRNGVRKNILLLHTSWSGLDIELCLCMVNMHGCTCKTSVSRYTYRLSLCLCLLACKSCASQVYHSVVRQKFDHCFPLLLNRTYTILSFSTCTIVI